MSVLIPGKPGFSIMLHSIDPLKFDYVANEHHLLSLTESRILCECGHTKAIHGITQFDRRCSSFKCSCSSFKTEHHEKKTG